jgi:hypothetical protein
VITSRRPARGAPYLATVLCCALCCAATGVAAQDTAPAATPAPAQVQESKDGFLSSLKQAFGEDLNKEVVRGHFDVGADANSHRYYCLVNPKSGKREPNGVSGDLVKRKDGMTGIKNAAVTPLSCGDAEQKGLLVTTDYTVLGKAAQPTPTPAAPVAVPPPVVAAAPAAPVVAPPVAASTPPVSFSPPTPAPPAPAAAVLPAPAADGATRSEVQAVFGRFVSAQNAHDRSGVGAVLLDSPDFLWALPRGSSIWGSRAALDAFEQSWTGTSRLDPQLDALRVGTLGAGTAVLVVPVLIAQGPTTVPVRWTGIFVKTNSGWRIASIVVTPFDDWRPGAR